MVVKICAIIILSHSITMISIPVNHHSFIILFLHSSLAFWLGPSICGHADNFTVGSLQNTEDNAMSYFSKAGTLHCTRCTHVLLIFHIVLIIGSIYFLLVFSLVDFELCCSFFVL